MHGALEHGRSATDKLPIEMLTAVLLLLPDPLPPLNQQDHWAQYQRKEQLELAASEGKEYERHGWLPAAWACHDWRSIILSQKSHFHVPIMLHDERSRSVLESLSPLSIDLYVDEEHWNEGAALTTQWIFQSHRHRLRSLHVWTILERHRSAAFEDEASRQTSELLLPNILRDVHASFLEEYHAVGQMRNRGGCVPPGHRDLYPRAVSFPFGLSRNLRTLDLSACTIANPSALKLCSPTGAKLSACPGIWDRQGIYPDPDVISDRDDVTIARFSMPFMFDALRSLYLDEDSMPSKEALAALGPINLPVLEHLYLSGLLSPVEDTFAGLTFPSATSVELICAWYPRPTHNQDVPLPGVVDPSSLPFHSSLAAKYSSGGESHVVPMIRTMRLVIEDDRVSFKCGANNGCDSGLWTLSIDFVYISPWIYDPDFTDCEMFIAGAFSIFTNVQDLTVCGSFAHESYFQTGALRRCRWYAIAAPTLLDVTRLVLSSQAAVHLLEFCEKHRESDPQDIFPELEEIEISLPSCRDTSRSDDKMELPRLLSAELEARMKPFRAVWDETGRCYDKLRC